MCLNEDIRAWLDLLESIFDDEIQDVSCFSFKTLIINKTEVGTKESNIIKFPKVLLKTIKIINERIRVHYCPKASLVHSIFSSSICIKEALKN